MVPKIVNEDCVKVWDSVHEQFDIAKSGGKDEKVVKRSKGDRVNLFTK